MRLLFRHLAVLGLLAAAGPAPAAMLPLTTTITQNATNSQYTYRIQVTSDVHLNTGDSFTIFDFAGFTGQTDFPATDWAFSATNSGPSYDGIVPGDDPNVVNLTWTYTGPGTLTIGSGSLTLGMFSAFSSFTGVGSVGDGFFSSQSHRDTDDVVERNVTKVSRPVGAGQEDPDPVDPEDPEDPGDPTGETPEPASLALLGFGALAGAARSWKSRRRG